jgi:hypothetical protein
MSFLLPILSIMVFSMFHLLNVDIDKTNVTCPKIDAYVFNRAH